MFEEPEAHLHPQLQREIFDTLRDLSKNPNLEYQIILTTHSPQFVDIEYLDELYIFNKNQGCTELQKCNVHFSKKRDLVKTILAFNPNISEIFFANHVVLFEGESEEITINYLKKNNLINFSKTSVVNTKGKFNMDIYINILNDVNLPYSVLIDEDSYSIDDLDKDQIQEKRKAYEKTQKIVDLIDEKIGKAVVVSSDYDEYTGISKSVKSKPTKMYELLTKNYETNPNKVYQNKIENLFKLLLNSESFKYKAINVDGTQWKKLN